jgi:hypothetical protein
MIMGLQTPFVNPLNRISVVASHNAYSTYQTAQEIISGRIDNPTQPKWSLLNLQRGISGHFAKEIPRLAFKPFGAVILTPKMKELFPTNPLIESLAFAAVMTTMEMAINPADAVRVRLQSGQPLNTLRPRLIKQLYTGSLGNGMRQFGTWGIFRFSGTHLDRFFAEHTTLDTKSIDGMAAKSVMQAILLTSLVYPTFERLKNELQLNPSLGRESSSRYRAAFDSVIKRSGPIGLTHGLAPKIFSNAILTYGFNWLVENGKARPSHLFNPTALDSHPVK